MEQPLDYGTLSEDLFEITDPSGFPSLADFSRQYGPVTSDLRAQIKEEALHSTYFLAKVVLGYDKLNVRVHKPMCDFVDQTEVYIRRMMLMPRTHFKTTIWTLVHTIKLICNDPNIRILMIADTALNATRFLQEIQQHFQFNEVFRWVFSEIIPENFTKARWSQTEMLVPRSLIAREPTVDAIGAMGGSESRHYDWIKADDLITEKCIRSDVEMDKVILWSNGLESLLINQKEDHIDFIGSRKKKGDIYEHQENMYSLGMEPEEIGPYAYNVGELAVFTRQVIEDGKVIFPEQISMRFLLRLRQTDPQRYHAQYANSPKGTGLNTFDAECLRYWKWTEDKNIQCIHDKEVLYDISPWALDRIILYDPSVAEKQRSSQQAIIVVAKGSHPFRIVLETHIGHYPPDEAIELILELDQKWHPELVSIERRGFQGWVKYWLMEKTEREGVPYPPIVEWPLEGSSNAQWAKIEQIRSLQPLIRANLLWVHETQTELIDQIEFHPNVRWDDGLDGLSQGMDYWPMSSDLSEVISRQTREDNFLMDALAGYTPREESWNEEKFLSMFDATGYGHRDA
jgi:hypothetical protein